MKITTENIKALKPCIDRFNNFTSNYPNYEGSLIDFLNLDNITYGDKSWVFARLATRIQNVRWAILCAESVLHNYESMYINDDRPRKAIEATKAFALNPSEENGHRANVASMAAGSAAGMAANSAANSAYYAANSAANAANSAANSANSAGMAANSAAYSAANAANSAASAAYSAANSARETQHELNLQFMVEVVRIGKGE